MSIAIAGFMEKLWQIVNEAGSHLLGQAQVIPRVARVFVT